MNTKNRTSMLSAGMIACCLFAVSSVSIASSAIENPYGSAASGAQVDRVIRIDDTTRSVQVTRHEIVRFEFANGAPSLQWNFDTLGTPIIKFKQIASSQVSNQKIKIYVNDAKDDRG